MNNILLCIQFRLKRYCNAGYSMQDSKRILQCIYIYIHTGVPCIETSKERGKF